MENQKIITYFHYKDGDHDRKFRVDDVNVNSSRAYIEQCVRNERHIEKFYLEVKDSEDELIDFTHDSIGSFLRNASRYQNDTPGVQPTNSEAIKIHLYIKETSERQPRPQSTSHTQRLAIPPIYSSSNPVVEQPEDGCGEICYSNSTNHIFTNKAVSIKNQDLGIKFTVNLNETLRDEYSSNSTNVSNGQQNGLPIRIQGNKKKLEGNNIHKSVLPMVQIDETIFPDGKNSDFELVCCFLQEICKNGDRILYHHNVYQFVNINKVKTNNQAAMTNQIRSSDIVNKKESPKAHIVLPKDPKMFSKEGHKIDLKIQAKLGMKTRPNQEKHLFCKLANNYPENANYETNRLGILIKHNARLLWDRLLLSNGVVFCHSKQKIKLNYLEICLDNGGIIEKIPILEKRISLRESESEDHLDRPSRKRFKACNQQTFCSQTDGCILPMATATNDYGASYDSQPSPATMAFIEQQQVNTTDHSARASTLDVALSEIIAHLRSNFNPTMNVLPTINIVNDPPPIAQNDSQDTRYPVVDRNTMSIQQEGLSFETDRYGDLLNDLLEFKADSSYDAPSYQEDIGKQEFDQYFPSSQN